MKSRTIACCGSLGAVLVAAALVAAAPVFAVQDHPRPTGSTHRIARHQAAQPSQNAGEEGEHVFEQNCARCHNAPDGFSTRITGTVVRHMRVRANLSQHDEQVLLHYFNQ